MNDLISRLEAAAGPDREMDCCIQQAVIGEFPFNNDNWKRSWKGTAVSGAADNWKVPRYTASIDAALTLVPEGFRWKLGYSRHVPCNAELIDYRVQMEPNLGRFDGECDSSHAVALCIASIKAIDALAKSIAPIAGQSEGQT